MDCCSRALHILQLPKYDAHIGESLWLDTICFDILWYIYFWGLGTKNFSLTFGASYTGESSSATVTPSSCIQIQTTSTI